MKKWKMKGIKMLLYKTKINVFSIDLEGRNWYNEKMFYTKLKCKIQAIPIKIFKKSYNYHAIKRVRCIINLLHLLIVKMKLYMEICCYLRVIYIIIVTKVFYK